MQFTLKKATIITTSALAIAGLTFTSVSAVSGTPVTRLYNSKSGQHVYTVDSSEANLTQNPVWKNEAISFKANASSNGSCDPGLAPVYRMYNSKSGQHFWTEDGYEFNFWTSHAHGNSDWYSEGIGFCAYDTQVGGTIPVYRMYNSKSGEHFLTGDSNEAHTLDGHASWSIETGNRGGIAFYAMP